MQITRHNLAFYKHFIYQDHVTHLRIHLYFYFIFYFFLGGGVVSIFTANINVYFSYENVIHF